MKTLKVLINSMPLSVFIGVNPGETAHPQPIELDVEIELDPASVFSSSPASVAGRHRSSLDHTVDYGELAAAVRKYVEADGRVFDLLEELTADLFSLVSLAAPQARRICIGVRKPQALGGAGVPMVLCDGPPVRDAGGQDSSAEALDNESGLGTS